jgi:hypothetical protein
MFNRFRTVSRPSRYSWLPALDLSNPRIAAVLFGFGAR